MQVSNVAIMDGAIGDAEGKQKLFAAIESMNVEGSKFNQAFREELFQRLGWESFLNPGGGYGINTRTDIPIKILVEQDKTEFALELTRIQSITVTSGQTSPSSRR